MITGKTPDFSEYFDFNDRFRDYASFEAAEGAVSKFIRDVVDEIWYKDLKNPTRFYTTARLLGTGSNW